ncbi:MAG TPA: ATP-dependent DNA helicase RecQ [Puia sp.]|jgi:ATP-dependent DNA helicase RecQ|nr:ATP-dependent DNA helicase RecQ [Puia sp.]
MNRIASDVLKQYWNYDSFRPQQEEIVKSVLDGHDTLAMLPTGGGKSICFQVPTLVNEGLCLVISPLIALMKDQVQNLRKKGITAFAIYSGMSRKDVISTFQLAATGNCRFLYVSPERLETELFKEFLPALHISLIAVDEAHCISQWGYDFRPPYLRIADIRDELPAIPVLALTASATPAILDDICLKLKMNNPKIFTQSFLRPNLSFSAHNTSSVFNKMLDILRRLKGSSIIYCRNRRRTKEISDMLNMHGIPADYYHAGLSQEGRNDKQERWMKNSIRVIVCTNAFGMGIDKPDVRLVIHAEVPDNLENYYQEAGRAGRDGIKSYAVLLYNEEMLDELSVLHKMQYPSLNYIRKIYQGLVNYFQVPLGTEQVSYTFDLNDFLKKFSFQSKPAQTALQVLQQEGFITLNDPVFIPATLYFICNRDVLSQFENENPALDPLIKTLLRSYAGIYDQPVSIHEKMLASLLSWELERVVKGLYELHKFHIVDYNPQKETPQIYYNLPRRKANDIQIDEKAYLFRKEQFIKRVNGILAYVQTKKCRSVAIAEYFGERGPENCGICDNCVKKEKERLSPAEFESIYQKLREGARSQSLTAIDLFGQFADIHSDHLRKVIDFMQAENKLVVDEYGIVHIS